MEERLKRVKMSFAISKKFVSTL